jgi:hypothetical protein
MGKWWWRLNIAQILCNHVCKWKMIPVETIPGISRGWYEGE